MKSTSGWYDNGNSCNSSGFTAPPGGFRNYNGGFTSLGNYALFWSASEVEATYAWSRYLYYSNDGMHRYKNRKSYGSSIRCLRSKTAPTANFTYSPYMGAILTNFQFDASSSTDPETTVNDLEVRWDWNGDGIWDTDYSKTKTNTHLYTSPGSYSVILEVKDESGLADTETKTVNVADGTFTDSRDEHEYTYKTIGTQTWMAENLNYNAVNSYCYDNNSSNCLIYGRLYTRETAKTACPFGWHLPSGAEWTTLTHYLGTSVVAK